MLREKNDIQAIIFSKMCCGFIKCVLKDFSVILEIKVNIQQVS